MRNLNNIRIYDIECDALLDDVTKIHCLSVCWRDSSSGSIKVWSTTDHQKMREFFERKDITRVGHNITLYDERVITKLLGVDTLETKDNIIDTLPLSQTLFVDRRKHGLEEWGNDIGIKKIEIKDWKNLTSQEYIHRCEEDTKINFEVWERCLDYLRKIYRDDPNETQEEVDEKILRYIDYLQFKLECVREQEDYPLKLDVIHVKASIDQLKTELDLKNSVLKQVLPRVPIKVKKTYKECIVLEDGLIVVKGDLLYDHYFKQGYKPKYEYTAEIIKGYKDNNPNSVAQVKDWLFSLGWKPRTFKQVKDEETKIIRKIPQIMSDKRDGSVCDSIKDLELKHPEVGVLDSMGILSHRIGILEGFLNDARNGYIQASMAGLTNTLRLKHAKIVNLPGVGKKYGKIIRGSLIAEEDGLLCGSDMSALEDTTKQHYIYKYDKDYVLEMRVPGFCPHLDIAVLTGLLTEEQVEEHKLYEKSEGKAGKSYKAKRHLAKTTNFTATYGAGPPRIAETAGVSLKEGQRFHKVYWERNKAVKLTAEDCIVKKIGDKKWLYNPISKFWYSLRAEKDRFSTLNQGTAVYCFDCYVKHARKHGIKISLQYHDEILFKTNEETRASDTEKLKLAINDVNEELKLNVPLAISVDFGRSYADCH